MKPVFAMGLFLACLLATAPRLCAQAAPANNASATNQNPPAGGQQPANVQKQSNSNPFPEDNSSVPVIGPGAAPSLPPDDVAHRMPMPSEDVDPVRSPEEEGQAEQQSSSSSSSLAGMSGLLPSTDDDDDTQQRGKHNKRDSQIVPEHHETAAEDENVGSYYLDNKDWKAALSRYESALVLDPDNPDVYWGLAESQRHLGDFASARANYQKVVDYDPGSRHAKEAIKALKEPEIANAKASASTPPAALHAQ